MAKNSYKNVWYHNISESDVVKRYNFPPAIIGILCEVAQRADDMVYDTPEDERDERWEDMAENAVAFYVRHAAKLIDAAIQGEAQRDRIVGKVYNRLTNRVELELEPAEEGAEPEFVPLVRDTPVQSQRDQQRMKAIAREAAEDALDTYYISFI